MLHAVFFSLVAIFLAFLARFKSFRFGLGIAFFILAIFMGVRYDWGNDYPAYLNIFYKNTFNNDFSNNYFIDIFTDENSEFGWKILNMLFKPFGFFTMVFVLTCFEYYVLYKAIKLYVAPRWYWLAVFIFTFNSGFMLTGCSMMRQFLAMTIVVMAIKYIVYGNGMKYFLYIMVASTIHTSALIMLPFYFIRLIPQYYSTKAMVGVIIGCYGYLKLMSLFVAFLLPLMLGLESFERYDVYLGGEKTTGNIGLGVLYYFFCFFVALKSGEYLERGMYVFVVLSSLYVLFVPFTTIIPLVGRLGYYYSYLQILTIPVLFERMPKKWWMNIFLFATFVITLYLYKTFFYSETWHESMFEYKSIFSAPMWM